MVPGKEYGLMERKKVWARYQQDIDPVHKELWCEAMENFLIRRKHYICIKSIRVFRGKEDVSDIELTQETLGLLPKR
ncbi:hypothetical protein KIN20_025058 [Parelaphostrongylus tenuis]|uniref:Uncharacterized protein n=1 Tax=Parelaphostrongylus tenuis TaxID=148309 RepID=A0AAD5QWE3_PARTN|nr:hypothetical protein KIN20_025058 [Parelaphostrongylus tenuis]